MSTRANVQIKDQFDNLWFYRHSDGYPEGTLPTLTKFTDMIKDNQIRSNVNQSAGWLIQIGYEEYKEYQPSWKIGSYEPTTCRHNDIEYLYVIDLDKKTTKIYKTDWSNSDKDKLIDTLTF